MKILHQKLPVTLTRDKSGEVQIEIHEDKMSILKEDPLSLEASSANITATAKAIGDENYKQEASLKKSLFPHEQTREAFMIRKILA